MSKVFQLLRVKLLKSLLSKPRLVVLFQVKLVVLVQHHDFFYSLLGITHIDYSFSINELEDRCVSPVDRHHSCQHGIDQLLSDVAWGLSVLECQVELVLRDEVYCVAATNAEVYIV